MINITVLCVGKLKEDYLRRASDEYQKRLGAFCHIDIIEIKEERISDSPSPAQIGITAQKEGERIISKIPLPSYVAAMCIEGKQLSSEELADNIEKAAVAGKSHIVFIIGGSWGLSDEVKAKADFRLSMSKMTFPHQLARVMLMEQIYRAFQINNDGKYHK